MNTSTMVRLALLVNCACFGYGIGLLLTKFSYLQDEQYTEQQVLERILLDSAYFSSWHIVIYLVFGLSLLSLTINLFITAKKHSPHLATGLLVMGGIWSGFMLLSGGLAIELLNQVADIYPNDPEFGTQIWITGQLLLESIGGGNELIGAVWVALIALLLPKHKGLSTLTKWLGLLIAATGTGTLFDSTETLASLFGITLIIWFLLLYCVSPNVIAAWKQAE
ncbi:hypothetical protein [Vibrio sp. SCSIO 43136]|uniref:hypothetical protein n=1 Tax=Vibrio sp. SCSIO 43136 TaxID=2819101 RepID=UPI0020764BB6|nr:hypothetical protein [Vibrio sp. SCSIO 43136]USD68048.1 hypothetical protein J4N39_17900 [Vibrio sp. SCSIO 43136]